MADGPEVKVTLTGDNAGAVGAIKGTEAAATEAAGAVSSANAEIAQSTQAVTASYDQERIALEAAMAGETEHAAVLGTAAAAESQVAGATAERVAATVASTEAISQESVAAADLAGATAALTGAEAAAQRAEVERATAAETLATALERAAEATTTLGATSSQMAGYEYVIKGAATTVANLEAAIIKAKAAGAPIPPGAEAQLAALRAAMVETAVVAETSGAKMGLFGERTKAMSLEATFARGSLGGLARGIAELGGSFASFLLPVLLIEAAFRLLPQLMKGLEDAGTGLGNMYNRLTGAVVETTKAEETANRETTKRDQTMKAAADRADLLARAEREVASGAISAATSEQHLTTALLAHEAALRGTVTATGDLAKGLKELGIVETTSLEELNNRMGVFVDRYRAHLTQGEAAAQKFAVANKKFIQDVIDDADLAGIQVPAAFQKIADKAGVVSKAMEENQKAIAKVSEQIKDHSAALQLNIAKLEEHIREIEKHKEASLRSADEEYRILTKNLQAEFAALEDLHRRGLISEREYTRAYNDLQLTQVEARREWERAVSRINADAATAEAKYTEDAHRNSKKRQDDLTEEINKRADLEFKAAAAEKESAARFAEAATARAKAQADMEAADIRLVAQAKAMEKAHLDAIHNISVGFTTLGPVIDGIAAKVQELILNLMEMDPEEAAGPGIPVG